MHKIPYFYGWLAAALLAPWSLIPTPYFYVRMLPAATAGVIAAFLLTASLGRVCPKAALLLRLFLIALLILGGLIFTVTGTLILRGGFPKTEPDCPYVVVLGAQVGSENLSERIDRAYEYLCSHPDAVAIVSGGRGSDEPVSEARAMFDALTAKGIPEERIRMEEQATSTWENLKFSLDILAREDGVRPQTLGVISNEYHLCRAALHGARHGLTVEAIPAKTADPIRFINYFIREIAGIWHYLLLGGRYT